jgi:acyl carrier protein
VTADDVDARIRSILAEVFGLNPADVGPDTSTDTVPAWDSLQHLTVVLSLEEEFDVHFDDEETVSLVSFPLIVAIVNERLGIAERA